MLHLKRWTGVSAGWVLSSEIGCFGEPTASDSTEGNNAQTRKREQGAAPRSRRPHACRETLCARTGDRKSTRLNSSHVERSYAVLCVKKKRRRGVVQQHRT